MSYFYSMANVSSFMWVSAESRQHSSSSRDIDQVLYSSLPHVTYTANTMARAKSAITNRIRCPKRVNIDRMRTRGFYTDWLCHKLGQMPNHVRRTIRTRSIDWFGVYTAAKEGDLADLERMRAAKVVIPDLAVACAAEGGHLDVMRELLNLGCNLTGQECEAAAGGGHLDCLRYAHEQGCKWGRSMVWATRGVNGRYCSEGRFPDEYAACVAYMVDQGLKIASHVDEAESDQEETALSAALA